MTPLDRLRQIFTEIIILPIRFYRNFISPFTPRCCKYYPTCSSYTLRALRKHGPVKGLVLGSWRLIRCNPWSRGGVDHVPEKFDVFYNFKSRK